MLQKSLIILRLRGAFRASFTNYDGDVTAH